MTLELKGTPSLKQSKPYLILVFGLLGLFVLIYATGGKIYNGISKTLTDTKQVESDISLLDSKIESLKTIKVDLNTADVNALNIAFPEEDSTLFVYSQLKQLAIENNVIISNIDFSSPIAADGGLSKSIVNVTLIGDQTSVENFLNGISNIAPLSDVGPMAFTNEFIEGSLFEVSASIESYFAPLPQTLPSQSSLINTLSDDEKQNLNTLKGLKVLSIHVSQASQTINDENMNPFDSGVDVVPTTAP